MPTRLNDIRWQLFSGRKAKSPQDPHEEGWLAKTWPVYAERLFAKSPDELLNELRHLVNEKETPQVCVAFLTLVIAYVHLAAVNNSYPCSCP